MNLLTMEWEQPSTLAISRKDIPCATSSFSRIMSTVIFGLPRTLPSLRARFNPALTRSTVALRSSSPRAIHD